MNKTLLILSVILAFPFSSTFSAPPLSSSGSARTTLRVGYVDVRKVFDSCTATQQATLSLKNEIESKQGALAKEEEEVTSLQKELREKEIVLSADEKKKKQKEIEERIASLQKRAEVARQELMTKEKQMTESIIKTIQGIITQIAKKENFNLILEKDSILYGEDIIDLSERVIEALNKAEGTK